MDVARRERIAEVKVPGRTRWAIYDAARETFFVNVAAPAWIIAIDAREPTRILKEYEVPAAGPHGLDLDPATGRLLCACDTGVLLAIDAASGDVLADVPLSGGPDVIFLHPQSGHLYVAIGDPGVIDVIDIGTMRRKEVVTTEAGHGPQPEKKQSLCVPAAIASCRGIYRYGLRHAICGYASLRDGGDCHARQHSQVRDRCGWHHSERLDRDPHRQGRSEMDG